MSIPVGTVRSRVFRARDFIDHKLRSVHDGGPGRQIPQGRIARHPVGQLAEASRRSCGGRKAYVRIACAQVTRSA
jgi:hypothetical protein